MAEKRANPDQQIAARSRAQHGVISITQLREVGLSDDAVLGRVRQGRLHRLHRGVYAVGYRNGSEGSRLMAAILACGPGAVISHRSAAGLWRLVEAPRGAVDVSVPTTGGRRRRAGIRLHRRASLPPRSVTERHRIPVTTPAQTIGDLRRVVPPAELRRAIRRAEMLGLRTGLENTSERTRSELEHLFLRLCESTNCRRRRSMSGSAHMSRTSSGADSGSSSRPTATSTTAAHRPSRTTTTGISTSATSATTWST
jgi:predicted transcriptional regulator of viral defense system